MLCILKRVEPQGRNKSICQFVIVSSDQRALGALAFARALAPCEHIAVALTLALALAVAFVLAP